MVYKNILALSRYLLSECMVVIVWIVYVWIVVISVNLSLLHFSGNLANVLNHANKPANLNKPSRFKRTQNKRAAVPTPCSDISYGQIRHQLDTVETKNRCRLCQAYSRAKCTKCRLPLCLIKDKNCFKDFHNKNFWGHKCKI